MGSSRIVIAFAICLSAAACNPQQPEASPVAPPATGADATAPFSVVNWGQRSTKVGEAFNVQADGNSGISFEFSRPAPRGEFTITFDGKPLTGVVVNEMIMTATIPSEYLSKAGTYPVVVGNGSQGLRFDVGNFTVEGL